MYQWYIVPLFGIFSHSTAATTVVFEIVSVEFDSQTPEFYFYINTVTEVIKINLFLK